MMVWPLLAGNRPCKDASSWDLLCAQATPGSLMHRSPVPVVSVVLVETLAQIPTLAEMKEGVDLLFLRWPTAQFL